MSSSADGDWTCAVCGNRNYATRTHCNMRKCKAPRDGSVGGKRPFEQTFYGGAGKRQRVDTDVRGFDPRIGSGFSQYYPFPSSSSPSLFPTPGGPGGLGGPGFGVFPYGGHPETKSQQNLVLGMWKCPCGNMNFPTRTVCNMRKCGAKKPEDRKTVDLWKCSQCGNLNYPSRTECNIRNCKAPRKTEAEMWRCEQCGNMNYPSRQICNMRKCGAQRNKDALSSSSLSLSSSSLSADSSLLTQSSTGMENHGES